VTVSSIACFLTAGGIDLKISIYASLAATMVGWCEEGVSLIAPNIVVYHLSMHQWQRDMIFLAYTYANTTYTFMVDLSVFAKKTLVAFVCFCTKKNIGLHVFITSMAGLCRVLHKNVLGYSKAVAVRRTFLLLTHC
jgi:hypothetical protein